MNDQQPHLGPPIPPTAIAATLAAPPPDAGSVGVVLAFGPGVGVEMVLLRWEAP